MKRLLHGDNDCVTCSFIICELCYLHHSTAIVDPLFDLVCVSANSLTAGSKPGILKNSTIEIFLSVEVASTFLSDVDTSSTLPPSTPHAAFRPS